MNQKDLTQWLFGELRTVLSDTANTGLSSPTDAEGHTDITEGDVDHPYPFIGVQPITQNPVSQGLGNGVVTVADIIYNSGVASEVHYERESDVRVSLIPVTDGSVALRDNLADAVVDHFSVLSRTGEYPDDVSFRTIGESRPQGRPNERVRGVGVPLALSYDRTIVDDDPTVAETVELDIDVGETVSDGVVKDTEDFGDGTFSG